MRNIKTHWKRDKNNTWNREWQPFFRLSAWVISTERVKEYLFGPCFTSLTFIPTIQLLTVELYLFDVTFQKLTQDMSESLPFTCEKACPSLESDVSGWVFNLRPWLFWKFFFFFFHISHYDCPKLKEHYFLQIIGKSPLYELDYELSVAVLCT